MVMHHHLETIGISCLPGSVFEEGLRSIRLIVTKRELNHRDRLTVHLRIRGIGAAIIGRPGYQCTGSLQQGKKVSIGCASRIWIRLSSWDMEKSQIASRVSNQWRKWNVRGYQTPRGTLANVSNSLRIKLHLIFSLPRPFLCGNLNL